MFSKIFVKAEQHKHTLTIQVSHIYFNAPKLGQSKVVPKFGGERSMIKYFPTLLTSIHYKTLLVVFLFFLPPAHAFPLNAAQLSISKIEA